MPIAPLPCDAARGLTRRNMSPPPHVLAKAARSGVRVPGDGRASIVDGQRDTKEEKKKQPAKEGKAVSGLHQFSAGGFS